MLTSGDAGGRSEALGERTEVPADESERASEENRFIATHSRKKRMNQVEMANRGKFLIEKVPERHRSTQFQKAAGKS